MTQRMYDLESGLVDMFVLAIPRHLNYTFSASEVAVYIHSHTSAHLSGGRVRERLEQLVRERALTHISANRFKRMAR